MFLRKALSGRLLARSGSLAPSVLQLRFVSAPKYDSSKNFLVSSLDYVRQVDKYQKELETGSSEKELAAELIGKIRNKPELLCILAIFHHELANIGITPSATVQERDALLWRYRMLYLVKLSKINSLFWEQCQYINIASRSHPIRFKDAKDIGILDPVNFERETYDLLQGGTLGEVDFREMGGLGLLSSFGRR